MEDPRPLSLLDLARALPVYRRQDEGSDTSQNEQTFARCYDELAAGGAIALFPEGTSHNQPSLQPLKTGAARIALGAEARRPTSDRPLGLAILPIGHTFDARGSFRSRALVAVGEPLDPAAEVALYATDPAAAVRGLTARIDAALKRVTLNYASWDEARLIARAADLYARPGPRRPAPTREETSEEIAIRRAMLDGYHDLRPSLPSGPPRRSRAVRATTACCGPSISKTSRSPPPTPPLRRPLRRRHAAAAPRLPPRGGDREPPQLPRLPDPPDRDEGRPRLPTSRRPQGLRGFRSSRSSGSPRLGGGALSTGVAGRWGDGWPLSSSRRPRATSRSSSTTAARSSPTRRGPFFC